MVTALVLDRTIGWVREKGPLGAACHAVRVARNLAAQFSAANREDARRKAVEEHDFDRSRGVQTAGIRRLSGLSLIGDRAEARQYATMSAQAFRRMLAAVESLEFPVDTSTFIDLGCGKGKVLLLAAEAPFARVVGVEFARELADMARANLAADRLADARRCPSVEVVWGDAAEYAFPGGPILIFMYNPFGATVMTRVLSNLKKLSIGREQRPILLLYVNPVHHALLTEHGYEPIVVDPTFSLFLNNSSSS